MSNISELISQRQENLAKGWQSFLTHPLHKSIAVVVEREKTNLPSEFVPWAPGIVIASDSLLEAAGRFGWLELWRQHKRYGHYYFCQIRVKERSGFWFVETGGCVLAFRYGSMPICARTHPNAINLCMYILEHSHHTMNTPLGPKGHGLCWVRSTRDGILDC